MTELLQLLEDVGGLVEVDELRYQLEKRGMQLSTGVLDRHLKADAIQRVNGGFVLTKAGRRHVRPNANERPDMPVGGV